MINGKLPYILTFLMITGIISCDNKRVFDRYQTIGDGLWHKDSVLVFDIPVTDTVGKNNILFNIRNDVDYNYSNLWLFVEIEQPGGFALKDTFELALAEPSGKWLGEGFGKLKTRQVMYRRDVFFPNSGQYRVKIKQGMRDDLLPGIHEVGVRIEKAGT